MTATINIERLVETWKQLQPFKEEDQRRLDQKFMLDFNYNSNRLEGNSLTYGQTKLLLIFDQTEGTASMRDYQEMKAHNVGLQLMKREAEDRERPLTENFIRTLNQTIQVENYRKLSQDGKSSFEIHVGVYKTRPNSVITTTGEMFDYASPEETPALMKELVDWYNKEEKKGELNPIELAGMFHYRYIRIHPFEDGNGRVARLMVNYILHRHDYPMIVVPTEEKSRYLQLLHQCDVEVGLTPSEGANAKAEDLQPFIDYMSELVEYAFNLAIRAGRGESIEDPDDFPNVSG
jgi:Fic family protein